MDNAEKDYGYIAYLRKAMDNTREDGVRAVPGLDLSDKEMRIMQTMYHEALRDYFSASLREINHLFHFDQNPNLELMEPKWELYKVSISFRAIRKFDKIVN